ncbi:MAG: squalene synthase HpnC [Ideonella sp. WA131b]|nr:squalene synthase HpnC [Ideonella sp. WA131b]
MSVDHYENFPVASVLCPPALRPAITALYHFARTADDIADEGDAPTEARLADLAEYRRDLMAVATGQAPSARWAPVFVPLSQQIVRHALPVSLLSDLLEAFAQDTSNPPYPDRDALLAYCRRSANPIGRLLLHLYGITDPKALNRSDAICTALQLINFWQDLRIDGPRGRHYVPEADRERHDVPLDDLRACRDGPAARALVHDLCNWAHGLMHEGAPLVHQVPGRAGWELRLVVQGGLRILEKIAAMDHASLLRRPTVGAADAPLLLWRALGMRTLR